MTSPSPLLYDTYYHIYNRGVNGEDIFVEGRNYDLFLRLFEKHLRPVTDLFAYCLLKNHFHLLVKTKTLRVSPANGHQSRRGNYVDREDGQSRKPLGSDTPGFDDRYISTQFSNFFNAYAKTINKAYGRTGSLFQHPFGRVPITSDRQFWNVVAYIHQNPQRHGFVKDFRDWKYSSYDVILTPSEKPGVINREETIAWFGTREEYLSLHNQWVTDAQAKWFTRDDFD